MSDSDAAEMVNVRALDQAPSAEFRRAHYLSEADWPKPPNMAPPASAPFGIRERWSAQFVPWFFTRTGGEPEHPDGGPVGHRWRQDYPECVADPQAFEKYAHREIEVFDANGGK